MGPEAELLGSFGERDEMEVGNSRGESPWFEEVSLMVDEEQGEDKGVCVELSWATELDIRNLIRNY